MCDGLKKKLFQQETLLINMRLPRRQVTY